MKEELKREIEENGIQDTAIYDVYKTSTGLYLIEDLCREYNIGNKEDTKIVKGNLCYKVKDSELEIINQESANQEVRLFPNIITIFDLQLVLSFNVYVDKKHENKLYISTSNCTKYDITPQSKRMINGTTYCNVLEEDIQKIEDQTAKEKIAFKRKYIDIDLDDEVKPAEFLYIYYFDMDSKKSYVRRNMYEFFQSNGINIEGNPKIIDNNNCYSITENELKEAEDKLNYRGIEQIVHDNTNQLCFPKEEEIKDLIDQIYEFKNRIGLFEQIKQYNEEQPEENKSADIIRPYIDVVMPYIESTEKTQDKIMPYIDIVMPYIHKETVEQDKIMPYIDIIEPYINKEMAEQDKIMPYIDIVIPYINQESQNVVVYKDKKQNQLYAPTELMEDNNYETKTIMNKNCYCISESDLDKVKGKPIVVTVYPAKKKEYYVLVCNHEDHLFVSQNTLSELGLFLENPHRISINQEIYEEITKEDIELIKELESDKVHVEIEMKNIAPKRG